MKLLKTVLIGSIAIVGFSLFAPTFPELPRRSTEDVVAFYLDDTGERLLVGTQQHNYVFGLPANHLNDSCAPSVDDTKPPTCLVTQGRTSLEEIRLKPSGAVMASIQIVFGGYDASLPGFHGTLSQGDKEQLGKLGFSPSNAGFSDVVDPPIYMTWEADLLGQQYPLNSQGTYVGARLLGPDSITVVAEDPATLRRNRFTNSVLRPFTAIREGVERAFLIAVLLVTGANPLPSG